MAPDPPPAPLNESQQRRLSVSIRYIAGLMNEIDSILLLGRDRSPFRPVLDLAPPQIGVLQDYTARIRQELAQAARRLQIDVEHGDADPLRSIDAQAIGAGIAIEEMRSRYLRGYGALDPRAAADVDRTCDALARTIEALRTFVAGGEREDLAARLARLEKTPFDRQALARVERIVREQGLVEFRPILRSLVERLEERRFHVAFFGRVSSGKSSLVNALLGAPILPVGVTPVTAVPTRVRLGSPPSALVQHADGSAVTVPLGELAHFASEAENPGNVKKIARLEVVCSSPYLAEGIELVDTPGVGSLATAGAEESFAYLPRTDLALLLVDTGSALGRDEISLLRLLSEAAIPFEILVSKADLAGPAERERLRAWVTDTVARELGASPSVTPVSAVPAGRSLLEAWIAGRFLPLIERREELLARSIRRVAGRLLEGLIAALRRRLGRDAGTTAADAEALVREADARLSEASDAALRLGLETEHLARGVLGGAARSAAAAWREGRRDSDALELLTEALEREIGSLRQSTAERLKQLHTGLSAAAKTIGEAALDLFLARSPGPDLASLPVLDARAALPPGRIARPLTAGFSPSWAERRALAALRGAYDRPLADLLRVYGFRLRDGSLRSLKKMGEAFHDAARAFTSSGSAAALSPADRERLARDLEALTSIQKQQGAVLTEEIRR
jgi:GTP-binding protein EngB required for normal cell division